MSIDILSASKFKGRSKSTSRGGNSTKKRGSIRADIQGLRAFAVLAVIADHLFHWPTGGFIGVDVFFVISGFLITGLLLREHERTGRISFANFYKRRIKRILPASILVLVVTLASSFFILSKSRTDAILWDSAWALFFAGNWRFAFVGTDYFQASGPVSPLQHFWSLAVEEQFYFVWPWLMLGILALVGRRSSNGTTARLVVGLGIAAVSIASFMWALSETLASPTFAYFSTFSRAWELGVGAGLAVAAPALARIPSAARPVLAWLGLAGMVASLFVINDASIFPAPTAALPVLATALVIAAGTGGPQKYLAPLTNRVSGYIGDISYSLYLWHFPAIILVGSAVDVSEPLVSALLLVGIFAVSAYAYHLVEDPIRKSAWLSAAKSKKDRQPVITDTYKLIALSCLAVVTLAVTVPLLMPKQSAVAPVAAPSPPATNLPTTGAPAMPQLSSLQAEIGRSLAAAEWPGAMDEAISGPQAGDDVVACGSLSGRVVEADCTWGDPNATKTAVMVGDSTSLGYVATIRAALGTADGWQVKSYGSFGCDFMDVPGVVVPEACANRKRDAVDAINRLQPDVVFVSSTYVGQTPAGRAGPLPAQERADAVGNIVKQFQGSAKKIVFLASAPFDVDITKCYSKVKAPADCVGRVSEQWSNVSRSEIHLASSLGAEYMDSTNWFCTQGQCPSFVGQVPTKLDIGHLTPAYQEKIAPAVAEQLKQQQIIS